MICAGPAPFVLRIGAIEGCIVFDINKELRSGAVRVASARHGEGVAFVEQAVGRFVLDGRGSRLFLLHTRFETAALNHETVDDAVKDESIIMLVIDVAEEPAAAELKSSRRRSWICGFFVEFRGSSIPEGSWAANLSV